ncbi:MAG: Molybdopterin oxidoreductase iron-sulfur binding subunit [candidate division Zixibacteria bacterium RBG-1]|nr:MAG: Molybdopterin oxidoreductase iron-sulfur binding subunit [candidate division Zixibacteria bacterium RBG-1]OGC85244.1 MAG: 4Fe-4S ferredoxin [candidate division Zixibacteria bacterium RBG_19FT_COMBO_42_43]
MPRWGMVIDLDRCSGCQACVIACKQENNVPFILPEQAAKRRTIAWIHIIQLQDERSETKMRFLPILCQHCDRPPCTPVCPVGATYKNQEGLVAQVYPRCIGCRYCANACPYTIKFFNWYPPQWPEEMKKSLNPDVSVRPKGVVEKCTFCHHRLMKAKEKAKTEKRELSPEDYQPACAQACPTGAMVFGDLDDPYSEVAQLSKDPRAFALMEDLGTRPKVIYLRAGA